MASFTDREQDAKRLPAHHPSTWTPLPMRLCSPLITEPLAASSTSRSRTSSSRQRRLVRSSAGTPIFAYRLDPEARATKNGHSPRDEDLRSLSRHWRHKMLNANELHEIATLPFGGFSTQRQFL